MPKISIIVHNIEAYLRNLQYSTHNFIKVIP